MRIRHILGTLGFGALCAAWSLSAVAHAQIKAFPQAEGFGAIANGGRGGDVYHVTNLGDSGVGSLRYGIDNAPTSGRTIVFDVGGWITLGSKLGINSNKRNITIAGQTAPGGIGVRGAGFSVGGDDIVVRHMRFRPGKGAGSNNDSVNTNENALRVIYDHISAEFSTDGGFDLQADEVTLQYSSVSYGLISHSTGALIQSPTGGAAGKLSFHHNLWGHNETRNPKARAEIIDWRDNVIYNFHNGFIAGDSETNVEPNWRANFDGNTYISNVGGSGRPMMTGGRTQNYDLYYGVNALDRDGDSLNNPITYTRAEAMANQSVVSSAYNWFETPFDAPVIWQNATPAEAYQRVLAEFGATPWARDEVNSRLASDVVNRTGSRIERESHLVGIGNAGFGALGGVAAPLDSDGDGIPDWWELKHGTNPSVANNNGDFDHDGYTDLEEYLNDLAAFPATGPLEFSGIGRYADWRRWTHRWEPSRLDDVRISDAAAFVDAVGQKAGKLRVDQNARLYVTSGWLEVTDDLEVGGDGTGTVEHYGGEVRALTGGVTISAGEYRLRGGVLRTPGLDKAAGSEFAWTGGVLQADLVAFDLVSEGGTLAPGTGSVGGIGTTSILGDFTIDSGAVQIELASAVLSDLVTVDGTAILAGSLDVATIGSFVPSVGQSWEILSAANILGTFDAITPGYSLAQIGNSLWLTAGAGAAAGNVAVPEPGSILLLALGTLAGMPLRRRCHRQRVAVAAAVLVLSLAVIGTTRAATLPVVADAELRENSINDDGTAATSSGSGTGPSVNARWAFSGSPTNRNEWIALKFDLSEYADKSRLTDVALRTTMFRSNTNNNRNLRFYALTPGTSGEDWDETAITYGDMPGFTFDANSTTNVLDVGGAIQSLGTFSVSGYGTEGNVALINPALLTTFVQGLGEHNLFTLLISFQDSATGQWRIASREATATETGVLSGPAGSFAPYLQFEISTNGIGGDYNDDGVVDAADYTVWRDSVGSSTPLVNEEVSPTVVDVADYLYWRERFGATTPGGAGALATVAAVPEATSCLLLVAGLGMIAIFARR